MPEGRESLIINEFWSKLGTVLKLSARSTSLGGSWSPKAWKNFKKAKIETITFEVNLEDDYPIKPPFIRIVKPILSGSVIFPSGNMCMDIFGSKVWSASISLINVLTMIINYLKSTGTIKVVSVNKEYNYEKSKKSHINVIKHCHSDWNHH